MTSSELLQFLFHSNVLLDNVLDIKVIAQSSLLRFKSLPKLKLRSDINISING